MARKVSEIELIHRATGLALLARKEINRCRIVEPFDGDVRVHRLTTALFLLGSARSLLEIAIADKKKESPDATH